MNGRDLERRMIIGLQELSIEIKEGIPTGTYIEDYADRLKYFRVEFMKNYFLFDSNQKQNIIFVLSTGAEVIRDLADTMSLEHYLMENYFKYSR